MTVRKTEDGNKKPWICDVRPNGRNGKRVRKRFATKGEALAYEKFVLKETDDKPWLGEKSQTRSLLDMIDLWQERHGQSLAHSKYTYNKLKLIAEGMGDPLYHKLTAKMFTEYRAGRLSGDIKSPNHKKDTVSFRTCNNEQDLLNAVISELIRMEEWKGPNPLTAVRQFKLHETEMEFLTVEEMQSLITAAEAHKFHEDMHKIIKLCLATGGRFKETASLTGAQITKYKVTFTQTKGKKNRSVPISPELYEEIYKEGSGPLFSIGYSTVYRFIVRNVPRLKQQAAHVLRHTFASYYMMNGGNIIALQRILGHSDIKQTMRYAHLAPDHLEDVVTKNPLVNIKQAVSVDTKKAV
ncbi:tyrosine-type recombinase/integrase [Vibrio pelagius]|uniref:Tyrosine-type recombinase/integrase n=1 Tax=Vibrio pelagius TaxID=28169 RepID=A0ABY5G324_VIBPE|nr:tyrosine-type recombinase/integrase [Vibrio pelagius]UTT84282.1 tyrosine-type recombinase/integrase [Vibrio pelagius]